MKPINADLATAVAVMSDPRSTLAQMHAVMSKLAAGNYAFAGTLRTTFAAVAPTRGQPQWVAELRTAIDNVIARVLRDQADIIAIRDAQTIDTALARWDGWVTTGIEARAVRVILGLPDVQVYNP